MRRLEAIQLLIATAFVSLVPISTHAQDGDLEQLMAMDMRSLEGAIQARYDAGLAASFGEATVSADDPRYLWALETKVQCGIAQGYLKSDTRAETSIRNCQRAYWLMKYAPPPQPPQPPSAQGESHPRVPLPDGTRSPQNRRVEISTDWRVWR